MILFKEYGPLSFIHHANRTTSFRDHECRGIYKYVGKHNYVIAIKEVIQKYFS